MESIYSANFFQNMELLVIPDLDLTTQQYNTMLAGVANGVLQQSESTVILACMADGTAEAKLAIKSFEDFWNKQWVAGAEEAGQVVKALPHLLTDCKSIEGSGEVKALESWATIFLAPAELPTVIKTNVSKNILKMTRKLTLAKKELANEQYFAFGTTLGEMLVIATQPIAVTNVENIAF